MDADADAVRRLKKGDIGGLETLVTRYQVRALRAAFMILRDEQAAEDVTQETFLRVFARIGRFDESRAFGPYLLRSVVNAALDEAQRTTWKMESVGLAEVEGMLAQAGSVEGQAEFNQLKNSLNAALGQLAPRQRAAVVQRYYLGLSEQEMAQTLGAAPGTVKWLLNSARQRLRQLLGERSEI